MTTVFLSTPLHTTHYVVDTHFCVAVSYPPLAIFSVSAYPSFGGIVAAEGKGDESHTFLIVERYASRECKNVYRSRNAVVEVFEDSYRNTNAKEDDAHLLCGMAMTGEKEFQFFSKALLRSAKTAGVTIYMRFLLLSARNSQNLDYHATPIELKNFKTIGSTDTT